MTLTRRLQTKGESLTVGIGDRSWIFRNAEIQSSPKETTTREEQVVEIEGSSSVKSEPTIETGAKPKHKRQQPCYLEDRKSVV